MTEPPTDPTADPTTADTSPATQTFTFTDDDVRGYVDTWAQQVIAITGADYAELYWGRDVYVYPDDAVALIAAVRATWEAQLERGEPIPIMPAPEPTTP